ncbi:MAG: DUF4347 domain-containing protein, partial [Planctomycetota bacterium]
MSHQPKRNFHFFQLEERILLSGEGLIGAEALTPDPELLEAMQGELIAAHQALNAFQNTDFSDPALLGQANANGSTTPSDEAVSVAAAEASSESILADPVAMIETLDPARPIEIVFVDAGVEDAETLLADLRDDTATQWLVINIEAEQDGIEIITQTLSQLTSVDAIHLVSHGDGNGIQLGDVQLTSDSAASYAGDIASWGHALDADADLLIYGCDLASTEQGQDLIEMLAAVCNCDVAASDDATGHAEIDGDWLLEYTVGDVQTEIAFGYAAQASWYDTLATVTVTTTDDENDGDTSSLSNLIASSGGAGISLREAIIAANNTSGADTIILGAGTYSLDIAGNDDGSALGDLDINTDITIQGDSATTTIIDASAISDRIIEIRASGVLNVSNLTLTGGNSGGSQGAGVFVSSGRTLTATDVIFSNNTSTFKGGHILADGDINLTRVAMFGGSATRGGAIAIDGGVANLTNVTISGNTATSSDGGAGIHLDSGTINLVHSTIANNTATSGPGGGIDVNGGTLNASYSIIADNTSASGGNDLDGNFLTGGYNIIEDNSGFTGASGTDIVGSDPGLSSLTSTGGTYVHTIDSSSIGFDAATGSSQTNDQTGSTRDSNPDIGAYELVSTVDITSDLLLHQTFDVDASDVSGNNYDGTLTNGASIDTTEATNQIGGGKLLLGGLNDYVDVSTAASAIDSLAEGTISVWVYADSTSGQQVIFQAGDSGDGDSRVALIKNGDEFQFYVSEGTTDYIDATTTATNLNAGEWNHVVVTVDSAGNSLFVNGVEQSLSYTDGNSSTNRFMDDVSNIDFVGWGVDRFNTSSFSNHFDGFLDDGRVYSRALNSAEAAALYTNTADITSNLAIHLEFEENSGSTANDSSSNNNDGTLVNAAAWDGDAAVGNYSLDFTADTGDESLISVPDAPSLDISGDFTVAFWYNSTDSAGIEQLVGQYSVGNGFYVAKTSSGNLQFLVDGDSGIVANQYTGGFINDGNWHHVVAFRSGDTFQTYVDGVANTASTQAVGTVTSTEPFLVGGTTSSDYDGKLDDVRLYTRALASDDVAALFALGGGSTGGGGGGAPTYSDPGGSDNTYDYITNVTFAGINNTTGRDSNAYGDYTSQFATITVGESNTLSVTIVEDDDNDVTAWFDWNQDGDFDDAGEEYVIVTSTVSPGPHSVTITAPNDATVGTTRMRIGV